MRKVKVKAHLAILVLLLSPAFLTSLPQTQAVETSNITFVENQIPFVNTYYEDYSFVFELKGYFIRVKPFMIYEGNYYGMKKIMTWIKNNYPDVDYRWLVNKAIHAITYGFNLTRLPQDVADKVDYLGFRLVDLNFPLSWFELEEIEMLDENGILYNITRIHIPKANLVFSFEDLYPYGYTVQHVNSTYVLVGNVKGKTDLYVDPITFSSNIITVTGYTEGSPCTFSALYTADTSGSRELMANASATVDMDLDTQPKPADSVALKLNLVITGFVSSGHVNLTGTDIDGVAQTETLISISGAGTVVTSKWWKTVSADGIDCSGSYGIQITQSRWGVVWKFPEATGYGGALYYQAFRVDALLVIGDGSTTTWFIEKNRLITFVVGTITTLITVKAQATFRFGTLLNATEKTVKDGCGLIALATPGAGYFWLIYSNGGTVQLYDSRFYGRNIQTGAVYSAIIELGASDKIYGCILDSVALSPHGSDVKRVNVHTVKLMLSAAGIRRPLSTPTIEDVLVYDNAIGVSLTRDCPTIVIKGGVFKSNTVFMDLLGFGETRNYYLVNTESDAWTFTWSAQTQNFRVYRQYEFDLLVQNETTPITGANVTITYEGEGGGTVGSWLTNSTGQISTQTLSKSFYNFTGGDTEYVYYPYVLNITASGYQSYQTKWTPTEKTSWQIALLPLVSDDSGYWTLGFAPGLFLGIVVALAIALGLKRKG